jgi:hypothetical protein
MEKRGGIGRSQALNKKLGGKLKNKILLKISERMSL